MCEIKTSHPFQISKSKSTLMYSYNISTYPLYRIIHSNIYIDIYQDIITKIISHIDEICKIPISNNYSFINRIYTHIKQCDIVRCCHIWNIVSCMSRKSILRNYDIYEEIYLGILSTHILPFHHITYIECIVDECSYHIAIDVTIKPSHKIHIYIEHTIESLLDIIVNRYNPKSITIEM